MALAFALGVALSAGALGRAVTGAVGAGTGAGGVARDAAGASAGAPGAGPGAGTPGDLPGAGRGAGAVARDAAGALPDAAEAPANAPGAGSGAALVSPGACAALSAPTGRVVTVDTAGELEAAVADLASGTTVMIDDGTYELDRTLHIRGGVTNVGLRGAGGDRDAVVIVGRGMDNDDYGSVPHGVVVSDASDVTIADLTVRDVRYHAVQLQGERGARGVRLYNVRLVDAGEQLVKGSTAGPPGPYGDDGEVACSLLEYTDRARDDYTNGVDVLGGANWVVRDNDFVRIRAPIGQLAGPAVLFWRNAIGTVVERNRFVDCDRAIALGLSAPDPVMARDGEATYDHQGGVVRNNSIYRSYGAPTGDVGITANYARDFRILHNTVIHNGTFPQGAIEYRFAISRGEILGNLTDAPIWRRDGAAALVEGNVIDAVPAMFDDAPAGNLHLLPTAWTVIDRAPAVPGLVDDMDGDRRPWGAAADVGADEWVSQAGTGGGVIWLPFAVAGSVVVLPGTASPTAHVALSATATGPLPTKSALPSASATGPAATPAAPPSASPSVTTAATVPPVPSECGDVPTFADDRVPERLLHVSPRGDDLTGDGSLALPFASIGRAARDARAGTAIRVEPGVYPGGQWLEDVRGAADAPIWIGGVPGQVDPVIEGGGEGMHLVRPAWVVIHDLEVRGARDNGINADDGGDYADATAAHHVVFRDVSVHDIGSSGNQDCLKLSGLNDVVVVDAAFARCGGGDSGSGIDMVGAHRVVIARSTFQEHAANAVQAKGGSADIEVRWNRMRDAGQRAVNMGGSTGFEYFRPPLATDAPNAEARDVRVVANVIEGGTTPFGFVGCVDCLAAHNTVIDPDRWLMRILQETTSSGDYTFEAANGGRVVNNVFVFARAQVSTDVNIGPNTAPSTFAFAGNLWYAHDAPARSRPDLPVGETGGVVGQDPRLDDVYLPRAGSPAVAAGVRIEGVPGDLVGACYGDPPTIGAREARWRLGVVAVRTPSSLESMTADRWSVPRRAAAAGPLVRPFLPALHGGR